MNDPVSLSTAELQVLAELDARQFGFIKLNEEVNAKKKSIALKAIQYLERLIVQAQIEAKRRGTDDDNNNEKSLDGFVVDPKTYCKLGHLHLLLEDYSKALSAYQKFYKLVKDNWKDPIFLYGQGLVYFQYNAFQWATKAFQQVLYIDPGFQRANEVHLRLGLMAKVNNDYETSLKHFQLPLNDLAPCSFTKLEIRFHVAHLYEVQGRHQKAKDQYEALLGETDLPTHLRADIYRQLGWMYHSVEALGEKNQRIDQAIQCLQKSIEADPKSGQSLYLLGRCYASIGKVHDAFIAYRNSVDKSESNADTWCSIGVLYQQQNQPMDALQAYICAVQLDKAHSAAWTNLGILYESQSQPQDALACYNNATRNKSPNPNLHQRIKYLKTQMGNAPPPVATTKPRTLPTVEEAWNLPISNEMTNRQSNQPRQGGVARGGAAAAGNDPKRFVKQEDGTPAPQPQQRPPFYLNQQQLQTLQYLQNQPSLLPQQQQILQQLQHQFRLMQQHQQQMRLQAQQQQQAAQLAGGSAIPRPSQPGQGFTEPQASGSISSGEHKELDGFNVSDKELESLISQQDIGSFAESLLKQFQEQIGDAGEGDNIKSESDSSTKTDSKTDIAAVILAEITGAKDKTDKKDGILDSLKPCETKVNHMDIPTSLEIVPQEKNEKPDIDIDMSAEEIMEACLRTVPTTGHISTSVLSEDLPPPSPPERPGVKLSKEQLLPPTPSVYLENKKDAFSPQLQEFCLQHPITVVRGLAAALKLDLGLFSTKTLVELHQNHPIEIRTQMKQGSDENWDTAMTKQVWKCESEVSHTTLAIYARYQATTFQESLMSEQEKTQSSSHRADEGPDPAKKSKKKPGPTLKFGSNLDLSDERKWRNQLQELMKLPAWTRVVSAGNMLSHMGYQILGMNTVKQYMKVPCSRSVAHQESNLFCSINVNIGPGDCEWFGVPDDYWGALQELCSRNDVNYLNGSWWPNMKDLMDSEIPVYRFLQRPGDLVWVNSGCVHWVQAVGWCNNIAWNVGPLTHRQYSLAIERYEWNKLKGHKSGVAMVYLSWNLARNVRLSEPKLFETIKHTLMRSLQQIILTLEFVRSKEVEIKFHGRGRGEPAHYCGKCENEVFGVLFIREQEKKHVVHCLDCARRHSEDLKGFVCLEEYHMKELKEVYNNFKLAPPNVVAPGIPTGMTPPGMSPVINPVTPNTPQRPYQNPSHSANPQQQHRKPNPGQMSNHPLLASSMLTPQQQLAQLQALQQQAMLPP